jgi:hypothetical protein
MKKLDYVSPKAVYILLDEEDILTSSLENEFDQEHDAGEL